MNEFSQFKLNKNLIDKLDKRHITKPTPIQLDVIPRVLKNQDVIGQSKTGTGKTLSFLLPLADMLSKEYESILIIVPTKELARQVFSEASYFFEDSGIDPVLFVSGVSIDENIRQLSHIKKPLYIGVPGRIVKLIENGSIKPSTIKKLIMDEADFLIDLGFMTELEFIFSKLKHINQAMVFSATLSDKTKKVLDLAGKQKLAARIDTNNSIPDNIEHFFIPITEDQDRDKELVKYMKSINPYLAIVFTRTKQESNHVYKMLKDKNIEVGVINGDISATNRKRAMKSFEDAKIQYLIATDLASRGLDVKGITHIINYTMPMNQLDYIHRAGRTGRMHDKGIVVSICNELDEGYLKKYSHFIEIKPQAIKKKGNLYVTDTRYTGVKPRFNLEDRKKVFKTPVKKAENQNKFDNKNKGKFKKKR